jgi:outer membrane lipoprotein carrier protein
MRLIRPIGPIIALKEAEGFKKMKRHFIQRVLLSLVAVLAVTRPIPVRAAPSLVLGEILKKTESYYHTVHAFTAYFHQWSTSAAAGAITTEASGKLYYQKPRQMRWEYDKPESRVFVANHDLAWLHEPTEKQISLFDARALFASPLAQAFFDGIVELKKNFDVSIDVNRSNEASAVLKLVPRKEDPNIESLLLWIDMSSYRILRIDTRDLLGNTNRIVLDSQKPVPSLESALFQLEIPPSTTVMDSEGRELTAADIEQLKQRLQKEAK